MLVNAYSTKIMGKTVTLNACQCLLNKDYGENSDTQCLSMLTQQRLWGKQRHLMLVNAYSKKFMGKAATLNTKIMGKTVSLNVIMGKIMLINNYLSTFLKHGDT